MKTEMTKREIMAWLLDLAVRQEPEAVRERKRLFWLAQYDDAPDHETEPDTIAPDIVVH